MKKDNNYKYIFAFLSATMLALAIQFNFTPFYAGAVMCFLASLDMIINYPYEKE